MFGLRRLPVRHHPPRDGALIEERAVHGRARGAHALANAGRGHGRSVGLRDALDGVQSLYEAGALLPGRGAILAGPTYQEWLDAEFPGRDEDRTMASSSA